MAFNGRASRACENCRTVHVKCDEQRPECSRCVRTKRPCTGYREQEGLVFCHSNVKSIERAKKLGAKHRKSLSKAELNQSYSGAGQWLGQEPHILFSGLGRVLLPSKEDLALCFFYQTTMDTLIGSDRSQYLHRQLPILFSQSEPDSALKLATQAISNAAWARSWPNDMKLRQLARTRYLQSLSALNAAIRDRIKVKSDETLYSILLLSGYETITFNSETLHAWGTHIDGLTALVKNRSSENFRTPFSCNLFLFIRRNVLQSHLQIPTPVDPIFDSFAQILSPFENVEDRLLLISIHIPELLAMTNSLLSEISCAIDVKTATKFIQDAENLDRELESWAKKIPVKWSYTCLRCSRDPRLQSSNFVPNQIHRYPDMYTARVWNFYRVCRLIAQSIMFRVSSCVQLGRIDDHRERIDSINKLMVAEVCASVPYLLGYDCSQLKRSPDHLQNENALWPQCSMNRASISEYSGRFSLIWPLHVGCSVPSDQKPQQRWMRAQLRWIAEAGEAHAQLIQDSMNETLAGRPETFRFDCA